MPWWKLEKYSLGPLIRFFNIVICVGRVAILNWKLSVCGMHQEQVFLFLILQQPIDSDHMYGSIKIEILIPAWASGKSKGWQFVLASIETQKIIHISNQDIVNQMFLSQYYRT